VVSTTEMTTASESANAIQSDFTRRTTFTNTNPSVASKTT
jgi:hypothetical protein